jgi:hypothetical protein
MHTFRKSNEGGGNYIWTVGYYRPLAGNHEWTPIEDFTDEKSAAAYTNYLNGGNAVVEVLIVQP